MIWTQPVGVKILAFPWKYWLTIKSGEDSAVPTFVGKYQLVEDANQPPWLMIWSDRKGCDIFWNAHLSFAGLLKCSDTYEGRCLTPNNNFRWYIALIHSYVYHLKNNFILGDCVLKSLFENHILIINYTFIKYLVNCIQSKYD